MICPKCGYALNAEEVRSCGLCGGLLAPGRDDHPTPREGTAVGPPERAPAPPAPAPPAPGAAPAPADAGPRRIEALSHLKCRILDRPLRLRPEREFTVGRGKGNDIVIPSALVSRRHGRFCFEKGVWVYQDLDSSNGSRVNGKPATRVGLRSGDVVEIGGIRITYREVHDLSDVGDGKTEGTTLGMAPSMIRKAAPEAAECPGAAFRGSLADVPIADVLQLLQRQGKSGTLALDFGKGTGRICFRAGRLVHAEYGKLTGEIALHGMFGPARGVFVFDPREPRAPESILRPTTAVLVDAARSAEGAGRG